MSPTDRRGIVAGVLAAVVAAGAVVALLLLPAPRWTASASLLVLPDARLTPTEAATYYDRVGEQVIGTFARVVAGVDAPPPVPGGPQVEVEAVPDTTIITVQVAAERPEVAVGTSDRVATAAVGTLARLRTPYTVSVLSPAAPSLVAVRSAGTGVTALAAVTVALLIGGGVGWGHRRWTRSTAPPRYDTRTDLLPPVTSSPVHPARASNASARDVVPPGPVLRP